MLAFHLLTLLWNSDPALIDRPEIPIAPLISPARQVAKTAEPISTCAFSTRPVASQSPVRWLAQWEQAVQSKEDWNRSQREAFSRRWREDFNEHTVTALNQLAGQIDARQLTEIFRWRVLEQACGQICLEAVPSDELEGLFYASVRVRLRVDDGSPTQLVVIGRDGRSRTAWPIHQASKAVQLALFESAVPPAPDVVNATGDSRVK